MLNISSPSNKSNRFIEKKHRKMNDYRSINSANSKTKKNTSISSTSKIQNYEIQNLQIPKVTLYDIKKNLSQEQQKKLANIVNTLAAHFDDEKIVNQLTPFMALLLFDLKFIKTLFKLKHRPAKVGNEYIEKMEQLPILNRNTKQSYILALGYQQILEEKYGGINSKYVEELKEWIADQEEVSKEKVSFKNYDIGSIVSYLDLLFSDDRNLKTNIDISSLRFALGLFDRDF